MKIQLIKVDGTSSVHEVARGSGIRDIEKLIGCECCDTVNLRDGRVMFVDDHGYEVVAENRDVQGASIITLVPVAARRLVNAEATKLYHAICKPGTTHQIVGDVAIVLDSDFA